MQRNSGGHRETSKVKAFIIGAPVLLICAVGPWLIPWPQADETSTAGTEAPSPASSAEQGPDGGTPSPSAPSAPTDADVSDLVKDVHDQARGGYDLPVDPREVSSVSTVPGPYRELGRITIPTIGLDVTYGEGVFAKTLTKGPGHWPGTPLPGRRGNSVISGHRNTHTQPFKELDVLRPGDKITIESGDDSTTFAVTRTKIVPEEEYVDYVLRQPKDADSREITLFACHPEGNPIYRIVVHAEA